MDYPEIFANRSRDVVMLNNVIVPRPGAQVTSNNKNKEIRWDYNLYPIEQGTTAKKIDVLTGPNDIVADPLFKKVSRDLREADFSLRKGSSGIDSGTSELAQPKDVAGKSRPSGRGMDRGAYEQ